MRQKRVLLIHYLCLQVAFPAIFLFNFIGLFFVVTTDEAGVASAVSIQEKNREKQRIRFATMSIEKKAERNAKKKEAYHRTTRQGLSILYD